MTRIEWTDETWNPLRGCTRVSEGCRNCYAERVAARFSGPGQPYEGLATRSPARWTGEVRLIEDALDKPLRWRKPRMVFVNSMSDLFHEAVPDEWIDRIFAVMALSSRHTFQVLTKRPERMRAYMTDVSRDRRDGRGEAVHALDPSAITDGWPWPLPNVWLGVSVEDQATADERIPLLLDTPAAVRWISAEPLLGPVDLTHIQWPEKHRVDVLRLGYWDAEIGFVNHGDMWGWTRPLDWIVTGGESGPGARPCDVAWIRSLARQGRDAGVPVFVKQLGARAIGTWGPRDPSTTRDWIKLCDRKGGDPAEWPADLRVREWPNAPERLQEEEER